jgi:hypothetical protein
MENKFTSCSKSAPSILQLPYERKYLEPMARQTTIFAISSSSLDPAPDRTAAVILSCSYGSGHKQATATAFDVMKNMGYHAYSVDVPDDVLSDEANLLSSFEPILGPYCPTVTSGDVLNTLIQKKAFSLINFLSGNDPHAGKHAQRSPR